MADGVSGNALVSGLCKGKTSNIGTVGYVDKYGHSVSAASAGAEKNSGSDSQQFNVSEHVLFFCYI